MRNTSYLFFSLPKNLLLTLLIPIFGTFFCVSLASSQNVPEPDLTDPLQKQLKSINATLANYPAQDNTKYLELNRLSINSKGKLTLHKQYQVNTSCTASKEETFLTDLDPQNIYSFARGNTMVITIGCKDNLENCVQRFFRNSCDVTFKPESFQKELLIVCSANLRNTEQLRNSFSQLIKLANDKNSVLDRENKETLKNNPLKTVTPPSTTTPSLVMINPEKKRTISLTMSDIELPKKRETQKIKPSSIAIAEQEKTSSEEGENLDLDQLIELLFKNE